MHASHRNEIKQIVVDLMCDEQLEVRLLSSITLSGLIHSGFIQVDQELIVSFDKKILFYKLI